MPDLTSGSWGQFGGAMSIAGVVNGVVGSYYSSRLQEGALKMQAQADLFGARSQALSLTGQADLDMLNARAGYNATVTGADMSIITAESDAYQMETRAKIGMVRAQAQAASAEAGAEIDDNNAALQELVAQSALMRGEQKEQDTRLQFAAAKSKMVTRMAAGNVDLGQGSALQARVSADVMTENAAIRIQQAALMDAVGARVSALNSKISASAKRASASSALAAAGLELGLAKINGETTVRNANINATAVKALADAGMLSAEAAATYKRTMAGVMQDNAQAAAFVRTTAAESISPFGAAFNTLLSGAGQVARGWYQWSQASGGATTSGAEDFTRGWNPANYG